MKNWSGNLRFGARRFHTPHTISEIQDIVRDSDHVKILGTRHSFNNIADCQTDLVSLESVVPTISLDTTGQKVTVGAGVTYGDISSFLQGSGWGLHNLASLPHITIAGAISTATHGSGNANGNLATAVSGIKWIAPDGSIVEHSRECHGENFEGMVVGLGGLGVLVEISLEIQPAYEMRQIVFENLPWPDLGRDFEAIMASAYSVSLFTDWQSDTLDQIWLKQRESDPPEPAWTRNAAPAPDKRHPIRNRPAEGCTAQMGTSAPWSDILTHFQLAYTPSHGDELQSEYFVSRERGLEAVEAVKSLKKELAPCLKISEIRTVASDSLWMSPCYGRDTVAIHFTWQQDWPTVREVLPMIEEQLAPLDARPHWGKLFKMAPGALQSLYPKHPNFRRLLREHDPGGKFVNPFLERYVLDTG